MLAHAADFNDGKWTDEQSTLAFHLLGTPTEFRQGRQPFDVLDEHGKVITSGESLASLARREVDDPAGAPRRGRRDGRGGTARWPRPTCSTSTTRR